MKMKMKMSILVGIFLILLGSFAYSDGQKPVFEPAAGTGKVFLYTGKKLGLPILEATIKIENGTMELGKPFYQVHASVDSLHCLGLFFRMNNRFTSTIEGESCCPIRYVKEIDQEGLLIKKKNYLQTLTFDNANKKVVVEKKGEDKRQEISLPPETYDPLSMFARYYLKDELHSDRDIRISLYDGIKLRQMVFHSRKEKVRSKIYGEVEAACLESTTPFSTFGDKEGTIRIWYTIDGKKIPILMELDLPVGSIKFELEEIREGKIFQIH